MTPRTEPMPDPVPEWLKVRALKEWASDGFEGTDPDEYSWVEGFALYTIARLLWERGEPEPVDPDEEAVLRILNAWYGNTPGLPTERGADFCRALAAYKAEKART